MQVQQVEISSLNPAKYNPRDISKDQLAALTASLSKYGFVEPVVVNQRNMVIVGGHQRVKAWQGLGESSIPVVFVDLDDAEEMALNLALNKISGDWDKVKLSEVLRELKGIDFDFLSTGFSLDEVNELGGLTGLGEIIPSADPDDIPEPPKTAITQEGDLYQIGVHRLLCGDHGDQENLKRLMPDERASLVCADPPYNIASQNKGVAQGTGPKKNTSVARLMKSEWDKHFNPERMFQAIMSVLAESATVYMFTSHHLAGQIWAWMKQWADHDSYCVWNKPNPMPSLTKRHWTWNTELCCYATRGKHTFNFPDEGHAPSNWTFNKPAKCDIHPTMKPVELIEHMIRFSSKPNDIVLDVCGGSGTTMVASQRTDRTCRLIERDPQYCDAIVARMKSLFPELPITRNGNPF